MFVLSNKYQHYKYKIIFLIINITLVIQYDMFQSLRNKGIQDNLVEII